MTFYIKLVPLLSPFILSFVQCDYSDSDGYHAKNNVETAHRYPHVNQNLELSTNQFLGGGLESYGWSLIIFPMVLAAISILSLCCFCGCICCRDFYKCLTQCCCRNGCFCCKALEGKDLSGDSKKRRKYGGLLIFLLLSTFIAAVVIFDASADLDNSMSDISQALDEFGDITDDITVQLNGIYRDIDNVSAFLESNSCSSVLVDSYLTYFQDDMTGIANGVSGVARVTESIQPGLDSANTLMNTYLDSFTRYGILFPFLYILGVLIAFFVGFLCVSRNWFRIMIFITMLTCLLLACLVPFEMAFITGMADICIDPLQNIIRVTGSNDVIEYYSVCEGDGPLYAPLNEVIDSNKLLNSTFFDFIDELDKVGASSGCVRETRTAQTNILEIGIGIVNIAAYAQCGPINRLYRLIVYSAFCDHAFSGFYTIHVSHMTTLALFFCVMVCSGILYQYMESNALISIFAGTGSQNDGEADGDADGDARADTVDNDALISTGYTPVKLGDDADEGIEMGTASVTPAGVVYGPVATETLETSDTAEKVDSLLTSDNYQSAVVAQVEG